MSMWLEETMLVNSTWNWIIKKQKKNQPHINLHEIHPCKTSVHLIKIKQNVLKKGSLVWNADWKIYQHVCRNSMRCTA